LRKNEPAAYQKALALIAELYDHPQTGTGKLEHLKGGGGNLWSRRVTQKHRLVYDIFETVVHVDVLSADITATNKHPWNSYSGLLRRFHERFFSFFRPPICFLSTFALKNSSTNRRFNEVN